MKKSTILLVAILATSFCTAQSIVPIEFDSKQLEGLVSFGGFGNLFPLSEKRSILNAEFAQLYLLDNNTGKLIKQFDETILEKAIDSILIKKKEIEINRIDKDDHKHLPFCSSNQFTFHRFYKIPNSDLYAIQIYTPLKIVGREEMETLNLIAFFDKNLSLISLVEIDMINYANISIKGGFFLDKNNFFVSIKESLIPRDRFMHYQFEDGKYWMNGPIEIIKPDAQSTHTSARHYTMFQIKDKYYVHNGKKLVSTYDLFGPVDNEKEMPVKEDQLMVDLKKISDEKLIGIRINRFVRLKESTKWQEVLITDPRFKSVDVLKKYHRQQLDINSMEVLDNRAYLLIFDIAKKKYLLDVIEID